MFLIFFYLFLSISNAEITPLPVLSQEITTKNFRDIQQEIRNSDLTDGGAISGAIDISSLTNITGNVDIASGVISHSSFTILSGGNDICFSTASVAGHCNIKINGTSGVVSLIDGSFVSSVTIPSGSIPQSSMGTCISTLTVITTGRPVLVYYGGSARNATSAHNWLGFMLDGAYVAGESATKGFSQWEGSNNANASFFYLAQPISGLHSFCLTGATNSGSILFQNSDSIDTGSGQFGVFELR